jgi:lysophospholipase L1-like esterase
LYFKIVILLLLFGVQQKPSKILVIGDSITKHGTYANELRKHCKCSVDAFGYVSYSSTKIRKKFEQMDLTGYDIVVFEMGINNIHNVAAIKTDFDSVIERSHRAGLKVVALTLPPFKGYGNWNFKFQNNLVEVNKWIMSKPSGLDYAVDIYKPLSYKDEAIHSYDGLHPDNIGHKIIAEQIIKTIQL